MCNKWTVRCYSCLYIVVTMGFIGLTFGLNYKYFMQTRKECKNILTKTMWFWAYLIVKRMSCCACYLYGKGNVSCYWGLHCLFAILDVVLSIIVLDNRGPCSGKGLKLVFTLDMLCTFCNFW